MGYKARKEKDNRKKVKELILSTVHEKLFSIQEKCKTIANSNDENRIPLTTLKILLDQNRVKKAEMKELNIIEREIPEAYNGILDSVYTLCEEIAKNWESNKISTSDIDSAINVNWFKFEERIELTYSTVSEVNDSLNNEEPIKKE